jgi:predicted dehydrogenase
VGDYYGRRGELLIRGLESGKHVIADKPLCTRLAELERIEQLSSAGKLCVGCQLNMRDSGNFRAMRHAVLAGRIGEVHTIDFQGQHPLLRGRRPGWYFEPGKHGGTINDLAVHAVDIIPWMTGRRIVEIVAARAWNARAGEPVWFQDAAQMMLRLDNGGGVLGDVSYLTPENFAYKVPCYWRFTLHGSAGLAETSAAVEGVILHPLDAESVVQIPSAEDRKGGYFEDFLAEIRGRSGDDTLNTQQVLASSRLGLLTQRAADENLRDVPCA